MEDKNYDNLYLRIEKLITDNIDFFNLPNENNTKTRSRQFR